MSETVEEVLVHLDAEDFGQDVVLGRLRRVRGGGSSVLSFAFDSKWLGLGHRLTLDPALGLYEGDQFALGGELFGIFTDIAPDRWGRTLLQRREATRARREGRRVRMLDEWDYLTGISDELRQGALRLADPGDGQFVAADKFAVPPMARLRQLEYYARKVDSGEKLTDQEQDEELALLVGPGSSLGGARPKANFRADDGMLWIAKFPSHNDQWDVGVWELVLNRLAKSARISVPRSNSLKLSDETTFTAQRFDRTQPGGRRLFASAMTLVGKHDHDPASYVDIAEAIVQHGDPRTISDDLEQLFRRVVFNVVTAHRDDHLRNHGFLGTPRGWRLSPAFDLNPIPSKPEHALALDGADHAPDLDSVRQTSSYYRVKPARAEEIVQEVREVVAGWRKVAGEAECDREEIDLMAVAFAP